MIKLRAVLRRRWPVLFATALVGLVAGILSTLGGPERRTTQFQAEQVIVANRLSSNPANVAQDALKVTRGKVLEQAAELLDEEEGATRLRRKVHVQDDADSNSIRLTVYDTDPERASEIVQAFSTAFLEVVNAELRSEDQRQLERLAERVDEAAEALERFETERGIVRRPDGSLPEDGDVESYLSQRRALADAHAEAVRRLQEAELTISLREPYSTLGPEPPRIADSQLLEVPESPLFRSGLLGAIGLLLGVGLVFLIERVNQRIDTREELAELISVPIIAEIGRIPSRKVPRDDHGRLTLDGIWSEHYRRVRSAIQFVQADAEAAADRGDSRASLGTPTVAQQAGAVIAGHHQWSGTVPRVFLFASALPGEGKSTSTAMTAMALAETGDDTLVINADFRRPSIEKYVGAHHSPSLADRAELSVDRLSIEDVVQPTHMEHLFVAPGGPPTQEVGGRLAAARELAHEAAAQGGTVLIDSSPLRVSNDPIDLLPAVDEVILVVRAGRSTVKSIQDTLELLDMHHAPVLGVVLIGTLAVREMYAYYRSYYHQAAAAADEARREHGAVARAWSTPVPEAPPLNGTGADAPAPEAPAPHLNGSAADQPFSVDPSRQGPPVPPPFRGPAPGG